MPINIKNIVLPTVVLENDLTYCENCSTCISNTK